jgi:hypothetical protein
MRRPGIQPVTGFNCGRWPSPSGDLNINGDRWHRLILVETGGRWTAVLDTPAPSIKLPVGAYKLSEIWLQHGSTRALRRPQESVNITESAGASLVVGGPLNHSMDLERSRDQIVLRHKVVGVDRNSYWLT